jgi:hypothetical protein
MFSKENPVFKKKLTEEHGYKESRTARRYPRTLDILTDDWTS